ncbi:hypothetical protein EJB05_44589, partial [Eragrostis curvula]
MARKRKGARRARALASSLPAPPPAFAVPDDVLRFLLERLSPAELVRAALVCRGWQRVASYLAAARPPPHLGYIFHPWDTPPPPPIEETSRGNYPAVFVPVDAAAPRLSLHFAAADAYRGFGIYEVHHGLVLLLLFSRPEALVPRILVRDPASRRRALLPSPPRDAVPDDKWRRDRKVIGVAVLSRAHPSRLSFEAVCLTIDAARPRAWVASVRDGACTWRALPRSRNVKINFDPKWFEHRCVHAAGDIYWHICNSGRALKLDPRTLEFSFLLAPAQLGDSYAKYRIGETPEDGSLCIGSAEDEEFQLWVREEADHSDNGWMMVRRVSLHSVYNSVPRLPMDSVSRLISTWLSDIDAGRTGKVFIKMQGYGRYSFHMETHKLERLETDDGKEYGIPIYAYCLAWPPAFLAPKDVDGLSGDFRDLLSSSLLLCF